MTYRVTGDEVAWKDAVTRAFERRSSTGAQLGFSQSSWDLFAELGLLGLLIPNDRGGTDAPLASVAAVVSALGRALVSEPFDGHLLSALLLSAVGGEAADRLMAGMADGSLVILPALSDGSDPFQPTTEAYLDDTGAELILGGAKGLLRGGSRADAFLVLARIGDANGPLALALVEKNDLGVSVSSRAMVDRSAGGDLAMDRVTLPRERVLASGEDVAALLRQALDKAAILVAAEVIGIGEGAIAITADYVQVREQFGGPLARLQSVSHNLAEMYADLQMVRSVVRQAIAAEDGRSVDRRLSRAALSIAIRCGLAIAEQAIQLHGGMGVTQEHVIGHYYIRMLGLRAVWGGTDDHVAALSGHWDAVIETARSDAP